MNENGQAYTLEAVIASVLIISSLLFALQVTAVTPLSASTSNQHIENQQKSSAAGVLTAADEAGVLKDAVLFWNETGEEFHDAERLSYYTNTDPPNEFGNILQRSFAGQGVAVNVVLYPDDASPVRMVYRGEPSDNAVSASRTVTIYNDDELIDANEDSTGIRVDDDTNAESFQDEIPNAYPDSGVYNVVRVEVTVWRM